MQKTDSLVKLEEDAHLPQPRLSPQGPFSVVHGISDKKPVFVPSATNWSNFENAKYASFILHNKTKIQGRPFTKLWEIFKEMANFIGTRNFRQCKLHHQKCLQKSNTVSGILAYLQTSNNNFDDLLAFEIQQYKKTQQKSRSSSTLQSQPPKQLSCGVKQGLTKQMFYKTAQDYYPDPHQKFPPFVKEQLSMSYVPHFNPMFSMQIHQMQQMHAQVAMMPNMAEQWLECHRLFNDWVKKMKQLEEYNMKFVWQA